VQVTRLEFAVVAAPDCAGGAVDGAVRLVLDEDAFERKMAAAAAYPEMAAEIGAALARFSADAFRVECLVPAAPAVDEALAPAGAPFYETFGERQVAAGVYAAALREREHMRPIVASLRRHVRDLTACLAHSRSF
jgi:hypothetical protein